MGIKEEIEKMKEERATFDSIIERCINNKQEGSYHYDSVEDYAFDLWKECKKLQAKLDKADRFRGLINQISSSYSGMDFKDMTFDGRWMREV